MSPGRFSTWTVATSPGEFTIALSDSGYVMKKKLDWKQLFIPATIIVLTATSCQANNGADPTEAIADMPNPASEYCEDQGYVLEFLKCQI